MIVNIPGVKYPVAISSVAEYKEIGDEMAEKTLGCLLLAGGAMASEITEEAISAIMTSDLSEVWKEEVSIMKPGPIISVLKDIVGTFSDAEQMAILLHEEAHIENGDLTLISAAPVNHFGIKVVDNVEVELRADAYASSVVGKEAMRGGLMKALKCAAKVKARLSGQDFEAVYGEILSDEGVQKRLAALQ